MQGVAVFRSYPQVVQFLYSLGNEVQTAKLGLERISAVLRALGDPHKGYRVIHVAGTNGKGSTCAMIAAGLAAAGKRVGLYTSPHLNEPTERIQVDGREVSRQDFVRAFEEVHATVFRLGLDSHPTYFETVTAMAFWLFREQKVEWAVIEVGLGGRLDATNVVAPELTVITPVDLDHQVYLGDTIELIAAEKAGILKPGVPVVVAPQLADARRVIERRASMLSVSVTDATVLPHDLRIDERSSRFTLPGIGQIECPLAGEHQVENATTAAVALHQLGFGPQGIDDARWPGRLEHVAPNPDIILDGAHNPAGARALARYLKRFYADRDIWMMFGAMRDKSIQEVADALFPLGRHLVFTAPHNVRAANPEELLLLTGRGEVHAEPAAALTWIRERATPEDAIVITGSLYLVGEARALLSRHTQKWS